MGRKTNPKVLRVGNVTHDWDAKWFSDKPVEFRDNLLQDLRIRNYLNKTLKMASISSIEIQRNPQEIVLAIHTSRPAVVIGRGGSGIEQIQKDLKQLLGGKQRVRINVQEVRNPDADAGAVATQVVEQLERRMPYRRILKQSAGRTMQAGAKGVRIALSGRLNGAEIARTEWLSEGNVPLHTFRADISYALMVANTTYGTIGVKVWINRGEIALEDEEQEPEAPVKQEAKPRKPRRKSSLAEKAKTSKKVTTKSK